MTTPELSVRGRENPVLSAPRMNTGFSENTSVVFEHPTGGPWTLFIDDEPLGEDSDASRTWRWEPKFFAGEVTAELVGPNGRCVATYLLDVSPSPTKLGCEAYAELIDDLWRVSPRLVIGSEPARRSTGVDGEATDPLVDYARLRRHAEGLLRTLSSISQRPLRSLIHRRAMVPLATVRRADSASIRALLKRPNVVGVVRGTRTAGPAWVDVPSAEETWDCAANRCLRAILEQLARHVRGVRVALQRLASADRDSDTRTSHTSRWPRRDLVLSKLVADLRTTIEQPFLTAVSRMEITSAGLNAVSADPLYARAWRLAWCMLGHGALGVPREDRVWISPTWEVYERWCFLALGRALGMKAEALDLRKPPASARWPGSWCGTDVELSYQAVFPARDNAGGAFGVSVSGERRPDIVLRTVEGKWIVFDAKYRTSRSAVLDAMTSAHVYRDSLRISGVRPDAAILLVPAQPEVDWLTQESFIRDEGVGVVVHAPGIDPAALSCAVARLLGVTLA